MNIDEQTYKLNLGKVDATGNGRADNAVTLELTIKRHQGQKQTVDHRILDGYTSLSIVGSVWDSRHYDWLSGGQNVEEVRSLFPGSRRVKRICQLWDRWHMNDARPGCIHQGETWTCTRSLREVLWKRDLAKYHLRQGYLACAEEMRAEASKRDPFPAFGRFGTSDLDTLKLRGDDAEKLYERLYRSAFPHPVTNGWPVVRELFGNYPYPQRGYSCHVCDRHRWDEPSDRCPETGYRWGTSWLHEPIPVAVLSELFDLWGDPKRPTCWEVTV